jgi:hypothetical protein
MKINNQITYICIIIILIFLICYNVKYFKMKESFNSNYNIIGKSNNETNKNDKIAFLFLTYNNLKRPEIWNKFFGITNNTSPYTSPYADKFTIYNHAKDKEQVKDILLKDKHIPEHIDTCWGCSNLVEANILLLREALKDPLNKKFILVSDSCVPIVSFDTFYKDIMKDNKSRINIHNNTNPERYEQIINPPFTKKDFIKHSGSGLVLNLYHAQLLVSKLDDCETNWKNMSCPDEHYFGNMIKLLDKDFNSNYENSKATFDTWSNDMLDKTKFDNNDINSNIITDGYINITKITNKAIDEIRDKKFLLIRKINENSEIDLNYLVK